MRSAKPLFRREPRAIAEALQRRMLLLGVEDALKRQKKVRIYYELSSQFTGIDAGAAWDDFKIGVEHFSNWEQIAVVTDVEWIKHLMNAFRFMMPGHLRVFPTAQISEARAWIQS